MQRQYFLADDSRRSSVISAIGRLGLPVLLLLFVALAEVHGGQSVVEPPMDQLLHERDTQFGRLSELLQQGNQAAAIPTAEEVARIDRLLLRASNATRRTIEKSMRWRVVDWKTC